MLGDLFEFSYYLVGFWLFVFSRKFRARTLEEWRYSGIIGRGGIVLEMVISFFCGVIVPVFILWWLLGS